MVATVTIRRYTGGATVLPTDITSTNTRASTSDAPSPGTDNPIPIPGAGTNYSYWVVTGLQADTTPTGTINNLRWYTDGSNPWTGITMEVGQSSAYTQASGTAGSTGDQLTDTNYTGGTLTPATPGADSAFGYTSGSPLSVTGSITNPSTGLIGNYVIYQLSVGTSAVAGTLATETITWQYDET